MSVIAPLQAGASKPPRDRRARVAGIAFAVGVHLLALFFVALRGAPLTAQPPAAMAIELRPPAPPPPAPEPVAPKRRAGGSPASAPRRAKAASPRPQPAVLPLAHIRPPAPVPILPVPAPTLAAPKGPELASPMTGAGVSVGTGGQGVGAGSGPGGPGGRGGEPVWTDGPTPKEIIRAYPRAALHALRAGSITLRCRELIDGRVDRCAVLDETPLGEGFGGAALKLSRTFRFRPFTVDGQPQETMVVIPYGLAVFDENRLREPD